ncbi:MAG: T9SS type A sorting domain-containing protein [Bacteroidota bacterium]
MRNILLICFCSIFLSPFVSNAQVKNVIVEKYYISDANDATDTTDGRVLQQGSITYRIYVQLQPGCKLRKIYGDANHALKIMSTDTFYNNIDRPNAYFGYLINNLWFSGNPTLALDSWLTLGLGAKNYSGILKSEDTDGTSIVGGMGGLLLNNDANAGVRLTDADGLVYDTVTLGTWLDDGFKDISNVDTSIFGSVNSGTAFISNSAYLQQNSGVDGGNASNKILVAQLTTNGELTFELNIEIIDTLGNTIKYVANGDTLLADEKISPFLKYPPECGCTDANYLEYNEAYGCLNPDSCKNRIVFGCMDPQACNYDPSANYNIQSLCCYPGYCNDRDIAIVCPDLTQKRLELYPNPANDEMTLEISSDLSEDINYFIYDAFGRLLMEKSSAVKKGISQLKVDVSNLQTGVYMIRLSKDGTSEGKMFMKY